ncbi:MAG TPA: hypothetical protein VNO22_03540 [Planctomycetota bacterium]|nr:hypothetical protein [Planctomycetota bacterium]
MTRDGTFQAFAQAAEWLRREGAIQIGVIAETFDQRMDGFSFEVSYTRPLGAMAGRRSIKIEVSTSEGVLFHVQEQRANKHCSDLPKKPEICC